MEIINQTLANRYRVDEFIRRGGMGAVYRGRDLRSGDPVAIKHLRPEALDQEQGLVARFAREGEALRTLNHPNIVKMLDAFEEQRQHFLVMEYISGGSLTDLMSRQPQLSIRRVVQIGMDLADALTRSHRLNIIHRDIKPANVLLREDGTPLLTDFGVARVGDSSLTSAGEIVGTYAYLSPEALDGDSLDPRADIWSFGVMLFEMLAGRKPFDEKTYAQLITAILQKPVPDLETLRPDAPIALVDLVYRMLERDRERRIRSVRLVGAELEAIAQGGQLAITTPSKRVLPEEDRTMVFNTPLSSTGGSTFQNLPVQTTPFVGREAELTELGRLLNSPDNRLITVTAPGGMGKTRLALEAARLQLDHFKDGVFYVALAQLVKQEDIVPAVADTLRFTFYEGNVPQHQQLADHVRSKNLLLVFDNFEHLIAGSGLVTEILQAAPNVRTLVTSRERLNIEGETLFRLEPMDFPTWETPADALKYSAMKLFLQSARRVRLDFEVTADNIQYIARICRVVQGIPLAIILAAAWVEMLSLQEIAAEIEKNLDFLESDQRDLPERQRSLRAVFDYSWRFLKDNERDALMKLSVFKGKFTREAAQEITGASLKTLMALVNKSLLTRDPATGNYETHNVLRLYAHEALKANPAEHSAIHERHGRYYLDLMKKQAPRLQGREQLQALEIIDGAFANALAAWDWAAVNHRVEDIAETLEPFAIYEFATSNVIDGVLRSNQAVEVLRSENPSGKSGVMFSFALAMNAMLRIMHSGDMNMVTQLYEAKALAERLGATRELAVIEVISSIFTTAVPDKTITENVLKNVEILKTRGAHWWAAQSLSLLAIFMSRQPGMLKVSKEFLQASNDISRSTGDQMTLDGTLSILALITFMEGDFTNALDYVREAVTIFDGRGDKVNLAFSLCALGQIQGYLGDQKAAWESLRKSSDLGREMGIPMLRMECHMAMGVLSLRDSNPLQAKSYLTDALEIGRTTYDYRNIRGNVYNTMAQALTGLGEFKEAEKYYRMGLRQNIDYRNADSIVESIMGIGFWLVATGKPEQGIEYLSFARHHEGCGIVQQHMLAKTLEPVRAQTPQALFDAAWERGKGLTMEAVTGPFLN